MSAEARALIEREAGSSPQVETGGILMGYIDPPATIHVTYASGPGPAAHRTPTAFLRDTPFCARILREHYERFGVDYVGECHSHVEPPPEPTIGDVQTLMEIITQPRLRFPSPRDGVGRLAVVGAEQPSQVELYGFIVNPGGIWEVPIED